MLLRLSLIATSCIFLWVIGAAAEMYEWKNADGSTGFTDDISKVPPKAKKTLKKEGESEYSVNITKSRESTSKQDRHAYDKDEEQGLSAQQREEADQKIKATWQHMKGSLLNTKKSRKRRSSTSASENPPQSEENSR